MSELVNRIRHKRYTLLVSSDVKIVVETTTGFRIEGKVVNASMSGIGFTLKSKPPEDEGFEVGSILPAAKLVESDREHTLGRTVIRTLGERGGEFYVGMSVIDHRVPLDGHLSKYIEESLDDSYRGFGFELPKEKFGLGSFPNLESENSDLFARAHHFNVFYQDWERTGVLPYKSIRTASMGTRVRLKRPRKDHRNDYIIMGSNDYLGLASHPEVTQAAKDAIDTYGFGSTGSPLTTGLTDIHEELEETIAKTFRKERAILFNSGYAANLGAISSLVQARDLVVADMISHASIQDGMQMCKGTARFFKHNSVEHLRKTLGEMRADYAGCLVATEGVFSMDGDVPPLNQIYSVAHEYKARLFVDEAHSFGVIGETGLGVCEKYGLLKETDVIMGTFSKICGGIGGFIATTEEVANWMYFWARSHMFSVSIPPSTAAAALKAITLFRSNPSLVQNLRKNLAHFKAGLASMGYQLPATHESAVVPVVVGDEKLLDSMNQILLDRGVFVIPITYPAVSRTNCRFRFTVMATHTTAELDYVLNVLELAMQKTGFRFTAGSAPAA